LDLLRVVSLASNAAPLRVVEVVPEEQSPGTQRVHSLVMSDLKLANLSVSDGLS
jgi:hypothetical protein